MALAAAAFPLATAAADNGDLWEMTTRMEMPGMQMPAMTHRSCQPRGGAYKPESRSPNSRENSNCQITNLKFEGNKTTWGMECTGKDKVSGTGEVTRSGEAMSGTLRMHMVSEGRDMQMTQNWTGKRLGACDTSQPQPQPGMR